MGCKTTILLICGWLAASATQAAAPVPALALLTIADGSVTVIRGRERWNLVEGQRLEALDIVRTATDTRVARLEFNDGSVLDLGPATEVLLQPEGAAWPKERAATAYLARGWAKLRTAAGANPARPAGLASASTDLTPSDGGVVLAHVERQAAFVFVELGRAQLVEHRVQREPRVFALGEGHAYARSAGADTGIALLRPASAQLQGTPRALSDTLPRRAAAWASRAAPPAAEPPQPITAFDLPAWVDAEPALRQSLRGHFAPPARVLATVKSTKPLRTARLAPSRVLLAARTSAALQPLESDRVPTLLAVATLPQAAMPIAAPVRTASRARMNP